MSERTTAPFGRRLLRVVGNELLGAYQVLKVADPGSPEPNATNGGSGSQERSGLDRWAPDPGQFAMLAAAERWGAGSDERPYLPRAFSYARWQSNEAHFLLEDVGPGTQRLCQLSPGDELWLLGPLGCGFTAPREARRAVLVGGGVGIAPLAILQDELDPIESTGADRAVGEPTTVLLGFRDSAHAEGKSLLGGAQVATDDGSVGHHGLVTDLLEAELDRDAHATVYACGPPPMLESVRALCEARSVPAQLALEAGMACGFGACYGCVVPSLKGYLRVCVDGPVIDASQLDQVIAYGGGHT